MLYNDQSKQPLPVFLADWSEGPHTTQSRPEPRDGHAFPVSKGMAYNDQQSKQPLPAFSASWLDGPQPNQHSQQTFSPPTFRPPTFSHPTDAAAGLRARHPQNDLRWWTSCPMRAASELITNLPYPVDAPDLGWCRNRTQEIQIELGDLRLFEETPELVPTWYFPAWYQTIEYFVSFHPTSLPVESLEYPEDFPDKTTRGKYAVSSTVATRTMAADEDGVKVPVIRFSDRMSLPMDYLHQNLAVYVWGKRGTLLKEVEMILVGHCLCSLNDFALQNTMAIWTILHTCHGREVGELALKYAVRTVPGPIRNPLVADITARRATLKWEPTLNDYGSPVTRYRIDSLKKYRKKKTSWAKYIELNPDHLQFELHPLEIETPYVFRVSAVNDVGIGDPCEFHFVTLAESTKEDMAEVLEARRHHRHQHHDHHHHRDHDHSDGRHHLHEHYRDHDRFDGETAATTGASQPRRHPYFEPPTSRDPTSEARARYA